jgi:hypothetical protein
MTHIAGVINYKLNELKDKRPEERALIEAIQSEINKKVQIISPETRKSLLQFPIQFTQRIRTSARDWTTQLHKWADYQLPELLMIDPIYLTTENSDNDCVLKCLVKAALGITMTNMVNYELIEELFQKDMNYAAMTVPGDPESTEAGNAWYETDIENKSVIEYLYDFAVGEGDFRGKPKDHKILAMFDKYADIALRIPDEDERRADDDEDADHLGVVVLPCVLRERVTDQVAQCLGPADVSLLGDLSVELFKELRFEGDADAGDSLLRFFLLKRI